MDMENRLETDGWKRRPEGLSFSVQEISLTLQRGEPTEGTFRIMADGDVPAEGYVVCRDERMHCLTEHFAGTTEEVVYRYDGSGMEEGETREGFFLILSNAGEYRIPYHVIAASGQLLGSEGELDTLFSFAALARNHWDEAVKIFYSEDFVRLLKGSDAKYRNLYRGLSKAYGNERHMDEFLAACGKKASVEFHLNSHEYTLILTEARMEEEQICEMVEITRNGWGYTQLTADAEGSFLSVERRQYREEDFLSNQCKVPIYVHPGELHEGSNVGRVHFRHSGGEQILEVTVVCPGDGDSERQARRKAIRKDTAELMHLYLDVKLKKITTAEWQTRTGAIVDRLCGMSSKALVPKLYRLHLLIASGDFASAGELLNTISVDPKRTGPEVFAYYLYLCGLYRGEPDVTREVFGRVEELCRMYPGSWRLAWLKLYLDPKMRKSGSQRWMYLEEIFQRGASSPVLYYEALHLANMSPTLIRRLSGYELGILRFGAKNGVLSQDLIEHIASLAEKEKYFKENLFRLLCMLYEQNPSVYVLHAICTLCVKGSCTGPEYLKYYRLGVEYELRVTRLYEFYMLSLDPDMEQELPRSVLLYLPYENGLGQERTAYLYAYLYRRREELGEIYHALREQIEHFVLQQLYRGKINKNLAYLYRNILCTKPLGSENSQAFAQLMFLQQLDCLADDIRRVIVLHTRLAEESVYPLENGKAYVNIYGEDSQILLEDEEGTRYAVGRNWSLTPLLNPAELMPLLSPDVSGSLGYDLYVCGGYREKLTISADLVARFRALAKHPLIAPEFGARIRMELIRYFDRLDATDALDLMLRHLNRSDVLPEDLYDAVGSLTARTFYEKAYEWLEGADPMKVDPKTALRLCSKLLEQNQHVGEMRLTCLAVSAFQRNRYDEYLLRYLEQQPDAESALLTQIGEAAVKAEIETLELDRRLLTQLVYTGASCMDRQDLFKRYVNAGGDGAPMEAYLHRACGMYLMEEVPMERGILWGIEHAVEAEASLSDMCRLAYLQYYCLHSQERNDRTDRTIQVLGNVLLRKDYKLPLFREYANLLEGVEAQLDKTTVLYRGSMDRPVMIHYRLYTDASDPESAEPVRTADMQHMYAGIYTYSFVLFAGELLQYFITDASGSEEHLDSGEIRVDACPAQVRESRYGKLNAIAYADTTGHRADAQELLEQYMMTEWMTEDLFDSRR